MSKRPVDGIRGAWFGAWIVGIALVFGAQAWGQIPPSAARDRHVTPQIRGTKPARQWITAARGDRRRNNTDQLSPEEKADLQRRYQEWKSLPPEKQKQLRNKMNQWQKLSPEDRQLYRQRFQQWQKISPEERNNLKEKLRRWESLPPQEQEAIRRRFKKR